jgi:hypothetical protein
MIQMLAPEAARPVRPVRPVPGLTPAEAPVCIGAIRAVARGVEQGDWR